MSNLAARNPWSERPKSVNTDWAGGPIQSKRHYLPVRDSVARSAGYTERIIESQLSELVAQESVESAPEIAVQGGTREAVNVSCRVVGGTGILRSLRSTGGARAQLLNSQRLQSVIVRGSQIDRQSPDSRERTVETKADYVALRTRK